MEGLRPLKSVQDPGLGWEDAVPPPRASHDAQRHTQEEAPRGHLFLFTKTLLSDMLDKKKITATIKLCQND